MQSARAAYWELLRTELAWPFRLSGAIRDRPSPWRAKLDAIGRAGDVPFHLYCSAHRAPSCVRDALAMLAIVALVPGVRAAGSPTLAVKSLVAYAATTGDERRAVESWFAPGSVLEANELVRIEGDEAVATTALLDLVADQPWPARPIAGVTAIAAELDAYVGVVDESALAKLAALSTACRPLTPVMQFVGARGAGRLRIASALAARRGMRSLLIAPPDIPTVTAALCEARARSAQVVIANVDGVAHSVAASLVTLVRARDAQLWTSAATSTPWCASSLLVHLPPPSAQLRRTAWEHDARTHDIAIDADTTERLAALTLPCHAITMAVRAAARIYGTAKAYEPLADIAQHFTSGGHDGMRT